MNRSELFSTHMNLPILRKKTTWELDSIHYLCYLILSAGYLLHRHRLDIMFRIWISIKFKVNTSFHIILCLRSVSRMNKFLRKSKTKRRTLDKREILVELEALHDKIFINILYFNFIITAECRHTVVDVRANLLLLCLSEKKKNNNIQNLASLWLNRKINSEAHAQRKLSRKQTKI